MKTTVLYFIFVFLLFTSCCKEYPIPDFTAEELSWMPYKEGDTLKMKGKNGKQLWLRFSNMRESTGKVNERPVSFEPQCPIAAERGRTMSVMNVSNTNKTMEGKPDTLNFECFFIGGFEYTINKKKPGDFIVILSSNEYFDSRKAVKIDTMINENKIVTYKDTTTGYSFYPKNPTVLHTELYITPLLGITRINFKNIKDADYEIY